jgi:GT2 family glycosyltransferase
MDSHMAVDVIIVNWNAGQQLRQCIDSVINQSHSQVGQIIVVDNGSKDGSDRTIEGLPNLRLIRAEENLGFGKACNLGAAYTNSEFLLFLNPDACVFPDSVNKVISFMQTAENAKTGICGVQLIDEEGRIARSCARFPSTTNFISHTTGIDRIIPRMGYFMSEWDHEATKQVDHVIGAFFMVRRQVFDQVQGFDETFFLYLEDLDFSYRAKQLGWSSIYLADVQAFHAGGGTSRKVKAKRLFYSLRSRILYAFKHFNLFAATMTLLATLLVEPVSRSMLAIGRCSWPSLKETWTAYGMLFRWLPDWISKGATR